MKINAMAIVRVACAIIVKEGRILVAQRSKSMRLPLKWEFPGGKIMESETEEECLQRELKEELNIEVQIMYRLNSVLFSYPDLHLELVPFVVKYKDGELQLIEHHDVRWLLKEELPLMDLAPADWGVVRQLDDIQFD
jgi:8-oxo-dGTP diphosphatase